MRNRSCHNSEKPPPEGAESSKSAVNWDADAATEAGATRGLVSCGE